MDWKHATRRLVEKQNRAGWATTLPSDVYPEPEEITNLLGDEEIIRLPGQKLRLKDLRGALYIRTHRDPRFRRDDLFLWSLYQPDYDQVHVGIGIYAKQIPRPGPAVG